MGSEAFVASGDKEIAERVSRNERPTATMIEAADAARRRETSDLGKAIVLSENSIRQLSIFPVKNRKVVVPGAQNAENHDFMKWRRNVLVCLTVTFVRSFSARSQIPSGVSQTV